MCRVFSSHLLLHRSATAPFSRRVLEIFGHTEEQECSDIIFVNWLNMARAGFCALEFYRPAQQSWGQAHMRARFAIMQVMIESGVLKLDIDEAAQDVIVTLDRSKIETVGLEAVGAFLRKLQVFKATADFTRGKELYEKYTSVPAHLLKLRDIVLARKKPRQMFVQPHLAVNAAGDDVELVEFPANVEGMLESMCTRFAGTDKDLIQLWINDKACMAHK
jgi:dipeptidyl-peptidase-3